MAVAYFVARELGVDTSELSGGAVVGDIVGDDTALDSRDGDTSTVLVVRHTVSPHTQMPFRWEPLGAVPPVASVTSITIEGEYRQDGTATQSPGFAALGTTWDGTGAAMTGPFMTTTTDYTFGTKPVDTFYTEAITDGRPWILYPFEPALALLTAVRFTYLRAVLEYGAPKLRQRNRGSIRQKNKAARQDSIRSKSFY